ncbi:unnamed protein product, partial [Hapterophycus canaliculatus]
MKKSKPDKATLQPHIDALIALKAEYKGVAGKDYAPPAAAAAAPAAKKASAPAAEQESPAAAAISAKIVAKVTVVR